ncbi:alpha/beta hydrolase family esterase [Paracoccus homiensis]|uniref:Polyhydroxybutyrate depolymerase n=1 Tax=Paracoccus homiensis TaxID=364199 RepID=A0A1I0J7X9_9RHOB|nr:hypothetical protein [Paracoccus homiensis]SEU06001.1 polyhydroxybutyrate depolymerase [Paracoccus homiensis]
MAGLFRLAVLGAALWVTAAIGATAADCGSPDQPCTLAGGSYHMAVPEGSVPRGIVMHLHGGGASGQAMLTSDLGKEAVARGYVLIAPNGEHPENRWTRDWSVDAGNMDFERDDIAFLNAVLADARSRTGMSDAPVYLAGFSRGASMVWNMACKQPDFALAYAPLAGAFWEPLPRDCAAPVRLFHTHGWADRTVPLEGRSFRKGAVVQGDVWAALALLRRVNGCDNRQPDDSQTTDGLWTRDWRDCAGAPIRLQLHRGGHGAPEGWGDAVMDWFEN